MRLAALAQVITVASGLWADGGPEEGVPDPSFGGWAGDDAISVMGREAADNERDAPASGDPAAALVEYLRSDRCPVQLEGSGDASCTEAEGLVVPDCEGLEPLPPLWRRERPTPADLWSPWARISLWTCPWDAVPALSAEEFQRLPLTAPALHVQPDRPEVFVNMPTIVYTDPAIQTFTTTLLGYPVEVEATPTRFTWDFGDGSDPLVTTTAGHPYPDHDVAHPYAREGTYTITLTVEHTGRFRLAGTTHWRPVTGTATTTTTSGPITAEEHRTHLVDGTCFDDPAGPYCDD